MKKMIKRRITGLALALTAAALVGCSGGNSDGGTPPEPQYPNIDQTSTVNVNLTPGIFPGTFYGEVTIGVTKSNNWELTVGTDRLKMDLSATDQEATITEADGNSFIVDYGVSANGLTVEFDTDADGSVDTTIVVVEQVQDKKYNITFTSPGNGTTDETLTAI